MARGAGRAAVCSRRCPARAVTTPLFLLLFLLSFLDPRLSLLQANGHAAAAIDAVAIAAVAGTSTSTEAGARVDASHGLARAKDVTGCRDQPSGVQGDGGKGEMGPQLGTGAGWKWGDRRT